MEQSHWACQPIQLMGCPSPLLSGHAQSQNRQDHSGRQWTASLDLGKFSAPCIMDLTDSVWMDCFVPHPRVSSCKLCILRLPSVLSFAPHSPFPHFSSSSSLTSSGGQGYAELGNLGTGTHIGSSGPATMSVSSRSGKACAGSFCVHILSPSATLGHLGSDLVVLWGD